MTLSKTDIENLNRLKDAHGALASTFHKGSILGLMKLVRLGMIRETVCQNRYWYEITAQGRKAIT